MSVEHTTSGPLIKTPKVDKLYVRVYHYIIQSVVYHSSLQNFDFTQLSYSHIQKEIILDEIQHYSTVVVTEPLLLLVAIVNSKRVRDTRQNVHTE
jgi:hypothetical protein